MIGFWLAATVMVILAVVFVSRPLIHRRPSQSTQRDQFNLDIARERLQELESELTKNEISKTEFEELRTELENVALAELPSENPYTQSIGENKYWFIGLATLLPVVAISLYLQLGSPTILFHPEILRQTNPNNTEIIEGSLPSVDVMLEQVQAQLEKHPNDELGWSLLANVLMKLGRYAEAVAAYGELDRLTGGNPEVLVRYADALAMVAGGDLTGKPTTLLNRALEINPLQPQGLWLAGIAAQNRGDLAQAVAYWYRLEPLLPDRSNELENLKQLITHALQEASAQQIPIPLLSDLNSAPAPSSGLSVQVLVEIDPRLATLVSENDVLFVFAHAENISAPIAAIRRGAGELPMKLMLDDSSIMISGAELASLEEIEIGARISLSGDAISKSGDLAAEPVIAQIRGGDLVRVKISRVIP